MDYEKDSEINESALDVEWLGQASLAIQYGKYYARCKKNTMLADEKIKVIRAQLIKLANDDPDRYLGKGVKPTGPNVEAFYRNHKDHKDAKEEWITAQYKENLADIAKWEISNTRKTALENLVRLHGQNYFAGPSVPRDLTKEWELRQKQVKSNEAVSTTLKRKSL